MLYARLVVAALANLQGCVGGQTGTPTHAGSCPSVTGQLLDAAGAPLLADRVVAQAEGAEAVASCEIELTPEGPTYTCYALPAGFVTLSVFYGIARIDYRIELENGSEECAEPATIDLTLPAQSL